TSPAVQAGEWRVEEARERVDDPRTHPLRNTFWRRGWTAGSSPAMTTFNFSTYPPLIPNSFLPTLPSISRAPSRGAGGAPVALGCLRRPPIGPPYTLTQDARERACDRRADASSNDRPEQMPALRSLRTTGSPWPRSICAIRTSQPGL